MTEQTVHGAPEVPPAPVPCAICHKTDHTTGNHNGGSPATSTGEDNPTSDGNHNGGRPAS